MQKAVIFLSVGVLCLFGCSRSQSTISVPATSQTSQSRFDSRESQNGLSSKNFIAYYPDDAGTPEQITAGPDGNLWYIDSASNITRLTTAGVMTQFPAGFTIPNDSSIAAGANSTLWFDGVGSQICRIKTDGSHIQCFVTGSPPLGNIGIVEGPDHNEWYTSAASGVIGKITPSGVDTEYALPDSGAQPTDITVGPDGKLWFVDDDSTNVVVGSITTTGAIAEYLVGPGNCANNPIVAGKDGNLWVSASSCGFGPYMISVSTSGAINSYAVGTVGWLNIVVGPDKQLWGTGAGAMNEFNTTTHVMSPGVSAKCYLDVLGLGPDGDVWATTGSGAICGVAVYEEKLYTIGIRLNGEMSLNDPNYGFELGYAVGTGTQTQTIGLQGGESVQFKNLDTIAHSAAFLGDATNNNAPWPGSFNGSTSQSPAGTAIGTTGWATGSLKPRKSSPIYETGLPGFYMIGCQYHYNTNEMRTVIIVH